MGPNSKQIEDAKAIFKNLYEIAIYQAQGTINPNAIEGAMLLTTLQKQNIMEEINSKYRK
jgi:hypothetical protein